MKLPFKGALYDEVSNIFDVVRMYPVAIRQGSANTYWFFMFCPLVLTVIYMALIFLVDQTLKTNKGKPIQLFVTLRILQVLSTLIFWVLLVPIFDFFISIFECDPDTGYHKIDKSMQCWGGNHSFYCALFSLGLIMFFALSVTISLLYNESRPTHTDALTRLDNNQELYSTIYRILLVVVSHYTADYGTFQWLALALHAIICIHMLKNYNHYLPYYQQEVSMTYGACCLAYTWLVANAFLVKALEIDSIRYQGQIIVICVGFILMWPTAVYMRNKRVREIMIVKQQEKIKDDLELDQFVTNFQRFMEEQENDQEVQMMFLGFLYMHREDCQQLSCPLRNNQNLYQPLNDQTSKRDMFPSKDKILHQHFVNSVFLDYQRVHPNNLSAQHHTSYAQFLFNQLGNVHMALIELNIANKASSQTSIQQQFTIFKYKQLIEDYLYKKFRQSKQPGSKGNITQEQMLMADGQANVADLQQMQAYASLDVTIVIKFENLYNHFEKVIEISATDHIEFWSHLDSNMIDLNVINKLGLNIITRTKRVTDLWTQLIKINPSYPNALYLYGNYLSQIKNDYDQGDEFKSQYLQVKRLKQLEDYEDQFDLMFAEDTAVVIMNGSKEQQGKIMKTNQGIFKLFGYSMFEVQGHDVNILMPPVIAQRHQYFLETYFKTGKENILNSCLESFAMYRTGVIFPVHLVVKPVPSLRNDIQYIGMIKSAGNDYEYILTDENGRIDTISEGVISLLKLPISFFKEHEIPIQMIVPELCEVCKPKNLVTGEPEVATYFDAWSGQKDLKFVIPKNFSNAGGRSHHYGAQQSAANQQQTNIVVSGGQNKFSIVAEEFDNANKGLEMNADGHMRQSQHISPGFIGMRSPESLKSVCGMFKNAEHKTQPEKYKNNLLNHVNYSNPDFERVLKTDIQTRIYAGGDVRIRVFKIFFNKKKKKNADGRGGQNAGQRQGSNGSESQSVNDGQIEKVKEDDTLMHRHGMTAMQALNDENMFHKYLELIAQALLNKSDPMRKIDLEKDIKAIRNCLERVRKARIQGKIGTSDDYEKVEIERMLQNLKEVELKINPYSQHKINNPIAAAFAHRLAVFVKTSSAVLHRNAQMAVKRREIAVTSPVLTENNDEELKAAQSSTNMIKADLEKKQSNAAESKQNYSVQTDQKQNEVANRVRKVKEDSKRELLNEYFKSNFAATAQSHTNDLVKNLQNKFKATNDMPTHKDGNGSKAGLDMGDNNQKDDGLLEADQKSVKFNIEDGGSVANDSKNLISSLRVLRNALYENYSPQSIENLKYSARFVIVVLVSMTIASFLFSQEKYDQLKENFMSVQHSQVRMQSVASINTAARFSQLMNQGMVDKNRYGSGSDFLVKMRQDINSKAIKLQQAQNNLSQTVYDFTDDNKYIINSNNITLYYNTFEDVGTNQTMNIWSAVMQLAINAYKIKDMALSSFIDSHMSLWFILKNSMNNILQSISKSTQGILDDTLILSDNNKSILLIIVLVASGCLLASMLIIMPVVTKVHKDKDKLLSLFLQIDSEDVKEQLKRCREFFTTFHNDEKGVGIQNQEDGNGFDQMDDGDKDEDDEGDEDKQSRGEGKDSKSSIVTPRDGANKDDKPTEKQKNKFTRKNKKLKKYSTNYFMLLIKFFLVITFCESYFLYQYFQSDNFLIRSLSMIKEAATITNRSFSNFLLYQIMIEIIATNGTAMVFNQKSTDYIGSYMDNFNMEMEGFLTVHSNNVQKHDDTFNSFFESLVYQSVCTSIDSYFSEDERLQCGSYLGGVLEKGLFSANLAYWDEMREIRDAFFKSDRSAAYLKTLINGQRMITIEKLNEIYFSKAYQVLLDRQTESINVQFDNRNKEIVALFSVYLGLLILSYFIIWSRFVESMRHSLWVTKSMLAIIPIEVIEKVKVIKDFLFATSQAAVRSMKE